MIKWSVIKHFFFMILQLNRQWQNELLLDIIRQLITYTLYVRFQIDQILCNKRENVA